MDEPKSEWQGFLATAPAEPRDRRIALAAVVLFVAVFFLAAPFAKVMLLRVDGFIPAYQSALAINDLITAVLLLGQFILLRRRRLLVLAAGYLFTSAMGVIHLLTFPGLFAPTGLLGAGPQTTAWLYMFWHAGLPLAVIAYALFKDGDQAAPRTRAGALIAGMLAALAVAVAAVTMIATAGHDALPAIMQDNHYTSAMIGVVTTVWALSILALAVLLLRRPHSVLDLWLMVALCAWTADIGLSAVLNAGRFDLGFYAGRIYGLIAASFVLVALLFEMTALYVRLARVFARERAEGQRRLHELEAELIHVSRLTELGQMVSAFAHEVNQPLAAATNYIAAGQNWLDAGDTAKARPIFEKAAGQTARAAVIIQRLRNFVKKRESERRVENLAEVIEEAATLALTGPEGRSVKLTMQFQPGTAAVFIDRIQIQQVLLNLIRNALEAMSGQARREITLATAPAADGLIEVSVADTGPGLAPEVRERLFQPFVTTKSAGMGVGLSICRSIVETHGGTMWADANSGNGTVFRFTLPRANGDEAATGEAETAGAADD